MRTTSGTRRIRQTTLRAGILLPPGPARGRLQRQVLSMFMQLQAYCLYANKEYSTSTASVAQVRYTVMILLFSMIGILYL